MDYLESRGCHRLSFLLRLKRERDQIGDPRDQQSSSRCGPSVEESRAHCSRAGRTVQSRTQETARRYRDVFFSRSPSVLAGIPTGSVVDQLAVAIRGRSNTNSTKIETTCRPLSVVLATPAAGTNP